MKPLPFFLLLLMTTNCISQDASFALADQNQVFNNPAFTGTAGSFRVGNTFRNKWPNISGTYITNSAYTDQYFGKYGGGGLSYTYDQYHYHTRNTVSLSYSYGFKIGDTCHLQLGIAPSVMQNTTSSIIMGPSTNNSNDLDRNFNLVAGALFYNHLFFAGYALHNINQPKVPSSWGFPAEGTNLALRHSVQLGAYKKIGENLRVNLFSSAHFQDYFNSFSQVLQVKAKHILVGVGYQTNNTVLSRLGIVYDHFRILYGYDVTISQLSNTSIGSHEFALQLLLDFNKNSNPNPISY